MKKAISYIFIISSVLFFACNNNSNKAETYGEKDAKSSTETSLKYTVNTDISTIKWKGSKPASFHEGTVDVKSGTINIEDSKIISGNFEIDMNSIVNSDLTNEEYNKKLISHLQTEDFFNTVKYS